MRDFSLLINPGATPRAPYGDDQAAILNADGLAEAWAVISSWPGYARTPWKPRRVSMRNILSTTSTSPPTLDPMELRGWT